MRSSLLTGVSVAAAMCCLPGSLLAASGLLVVEKTTSGDTIRTSQIQIEQHRMRAEVAGGAGPTSRVVIFDGAKQVLWLVDPAKKSYNEMTKADADRMGGQLQDAMSQMQAQLANLPPAQLSTLLAQMLRLPPERATTACLIEIHHDSWVTKLVALAAAADHVRTQCPAQPAYQRRDILRQRGRRVSHPDARRTASWRSRNSACGSDRSGP